MIPEESYGRYMSLDVDLQAFGTLEEDASDCDKDKH